MASGDWAELFNLLFYSPEMWGYLGVIAILFICYVIVDREPSYGILLYVLVLVMTWATYMTNALFLDNVWKVLALVFGGLAVCIGKYFE